MTHPDEISDPGAFRWVESGVSGLARLREWDASALVEVEILAATDFRVLEFDVLAGDAVRGDVPPEAVAELTRELGLEPPYAVRAVRQGRLDWAVAGRILSSEPVTLRAPGITKLEVVVSPDGDVTVLVDGEESGSPGPDLESAAGEVERRGRERFQAFVARADRVGEDRWELTIDPL
jgi:hypothetical protein